MLNKRIKDLKIDIVGGQIMSRVTANEKSGDNVVETRRVVIPKSISPDGSISASELPEEKLRVSADEKKITREGDIVIKLSTPYDAARVTAETVGAIVPSFCALVRNNSDIDNGYLLAYLNSSYCKHQLSMQVAGATMTILSVGKMKNVEIPIPDIKEQIRIGKEFLESQHKLATIKKIMQLEAKRNDAIFAEMVKEDD